MGQLDKKVLDHGFIGLVNCMGDDTSIVRSARVSYGNDNGTMMTEKDEKLIHYLLANGHNTPFESVEVQFEVKAPIFVVRQWHRHRTQSYNEVSARYTELPEEYYLPNLEVMGVQSKSSKQSRDLVTTPLQAEQHRRARVSMDTHNQEAFKLYRNLLSQGVPRELARTVLPLGTYTRFYAKANLNNWFRFLSERTHPHAQYEIRVYAEAICEMLKVLVPIAYAAWEQNAKKV